MIINFYVNQLDKIEEIKNKQLTIDNLKMEKRNIEIEYDSIRKNIGVLYER